jgi:hypothetical protein
MFIISGFAPIMPWLSGDGAAGAGLSAKPVEAAARAPATTRAIAGNVNLVDITFSY